MVKKLLLPFLLFTLLLGACAPQNAAAPAQSTALPAAGLPPAATSPAATPEGVCDTGCANPALAGGTITRALTSEPSSLDPQGSAASGQNVILPYLVDTLVYRTPENEYLPYLAESWATADDGLSVTFKLREGVTFHDGTPLDAAAVVYTIERFKEKGASSPIAGGIGEIAAVEALDPQTVKFSFEQPSAVFFSTISMPYAGIISPTADQAAGDAFGQKPVGSGPFKMGEWQPGVSITLERNPDYNWAPEVVQNRGPVKLEKAVFKIIPDPAAQLAAFQTGEVDVLFVNQPAQIAKLSQDANVERHDITNNALVYLGFQTQRPPFDDVRVRQALSHAVNKAELVETALGGVGEPAFALLSPTLPGFDPSLKEQELGFDLEKAKALLSEAGFAKGADGTWSKDGQPLAVRLLTSTRPPNAAIATVLQAQMKALGVPVEIQTLESQAAIEAMTAGEYDLSIWRYDWNDADVLNIYLSSARIGRTNRQFYSNPEVDALFAQAATTLDAAARNQLYVEAQKILLNDAPWQPLYVPKDVMMVNKSVQGLQLGAMGRVLLNDVVKAE